MFPHVDSERIWASILEMGNAGRDGKGVNRLALGEGDKAARDLFADWLRDEGAEVRVDGIGNIFGVRKGTGNEPPVIIGSHLDTVREAGIYDGALGVLAGLEVIRYLNQNSIQTKRDIVVADFTNEEGARFQPDMMGSMVYTGELSLTKALASTDDNKILLEEELARIGYRGTETVDAGYYLELHVEQGPVLYKEGIDIGVVEGIQGMAWWDGEYFGEANHAGTTPLNMRKDALLAAAELCLELRRMAETLGNGSVATMGRLNPQPDIRNVIPGSTFFTVDFRQYDYTLYEEGQQLVKELMHNTAIKHSLSYSLTQTVDAKPVRFDPEMVNLVKQKTSELGYTGRIMHSGAGHDAQFMTHICPTAMIFVPSKEGKSHSPEEHTTREDCIKGANVLLRCVLELAQK